VVDGKKLQNKSGGKMPEEQKGDSQNFGEDS